MPKKKNAAGRTRVASYKIVLSVCVLLLLIGGFFVSPLSVSRKSDWIEPQRVASSNGLLETTFHAKKSSVSVGNVIKETNVYNESYPGRTMVVAGGDTMKIAVRNDIAEDTNLHFHGSHVSPKGNSDNVFVQVKPGESFNYEYHLPENHPPGLYWYHPHWHGYTEDQVGDGMAGAVIVKGNIDELPGIKGLPERLLVLTTQSNPNNDSNNPIRLVNGKENPQLKIRPGEIQRWRILNASADDFYNFTVPGMEFFIISRDGNTSGRPIATREELMAPGDRIEILVRGPKWGTYDVVSDKFDQGFSHYVTTPFMQLMSAGFPVIGMRMPATLLPFEDLRDVPVDNTRRLVFSESEGDGPPTFLLDGKVFDSNRVDQLITLNTIEEWELVNESDEWHPFHIHINPFQVIEVNGKPVERYGYDDTFGVPAKGSVKIKTRYRDFDGKFVLHCHILFHEDHGMMQVVRIVDPQNPDASLVNSEFDVMHSNHISSKTDADRGKRINTVHTH